MTLQWRGRAVLCRLYRQQGDESWLLRSLARAWAARNRLPHLLLKSSARNLSSRSSSAARTGLRSSVSWMQRVAWHWTAARSSPACSRPSAVRGTLTCFRRPPPYLGTNSACAASMLTATCHCGAVQIEVPRRPRSLTNCNCSICRRYGTLWAYYKASSVRITAPRGSTDKYSWGQKSLRFVSCSTCGCITHWERTHPRPDSRVGVNARNFDPKVLESVRIRRLDGASTWKYLD